MDVDVVTDLSPEVIAPLVGALRPDYYVDDDAVRDAVRAGDAFNAVHVRARIKVDFFVAGTDAFERERLQRRIAAPVGSAPAGTLWIDTAEHTMLRKLEWYRRGGEISDRQWRDVLCDRRAAGRYARSRNADALGAGARRLGSAGAESRRRLTKRRSRTCGACVATWALARRAELLLARRSRPDGSRAPRAYNGPQKRFSSSSWGAPWTSAIASLPA